jgi:F-type H+-transporting ATPase subunit gamma
MEQTERLKSRLDNVEAVEPMLSALRSISSSSRVLALNRARRAAAFSNEMAGIVAVVGGRTGGSPGASRRRARGAPRLLVAIGSERGLCGSFNDVMAHYVQRTWAVQDQRALRLVVLGGRLSRVLDRLGVAIDEHQPMSATGVPRFQLAEGLVQSWLEGWNRGTIAGVDVSYTGSGDLMKQAPRMARLLPPKRPSPSLRSGWWAPWIEADEKVLHRRAIELWTAASFYEMLLRSSAAEHTARFQLLEGASQNAERLIDELRLYLQTARQEAITSELQDLAAGAGLIGRR